MKVNVQYAETHLADLISAADRGEEVEIARPDKPALRLVAAPWAPGSRRKLWGAGVGQIWIADDFNSPEVSNEIADLFEK